MKGKISCNIIQDLLPNYIEKLTSNESNQEIEQHMSACEDCKKAYEQMNSEIRSTVKVPVKELKFLKKVKRTRKLAALLTIILALILSYMLYETEFKYTNDKNVLAAGITDFLPEYSIKPHMFEIKEIDNILIASFKDQTRTDVNGEAIFTKGFNRKYRIISTVITEDFKDQENTGSSIIYDMVKENLNMIYMSMWVVIELGIILMIFFLTSC